MKPQVFLSFLLLLLAFSLALAPTKQAQSQADQVLLKKSARTLELYQNKKKIRSYKVALGFNPKGHKVQEGDGRTPEGKYLIDWRNPKSKYHLSLHISYPNQKDKAAAKKRGLPPGGDIMIHGLPKGWDKIGKLHRLKDWTLGCIAVSNEEIEEIWKLVPDGTPIEIKP